MSENFTINWNYAAKHRCGNGRQSVLNIRSQSNIRCKVAVQGFACTANNLHDLQTASFLAYLLISLGELVKFQTLVPVGRPAILSRLMIMNGSHEAINSKTFGQKSTESYDNRP